VVRLAEGLASYPSWNGELDPASGVLAVAEDTWERLWRSGWGLAALVLVFGYAAVTAGALYAAGDAAHTMESFVGYLARVAWGGVLLAAVAGAPSLAEDRRANALELYASRGVSTPRYLAAKTLAVFGAAVFGLLGPGLVYWGSSWLVFDSHPDAWGWAILGIVGYALIGGLAFTLLAAGFSAAFGSARAAVLSYLGVFAVADVLVGDVLRLLADTAQLEVGSPVSALAQQTEWLFAASGPHEFPYGWGLVTLAVTAAVGALLVARNPPRLRGEDPADRG
jgi:hypothetical protein